MTDEKPPWMADFVLATPTATRERHGTWDLYDPEAGEPRPMLVFVHGGPIPADLPDLPRDWPVYRGYGALAAASGVVGLTVDHRLHGIDQYDVAHRDVLDAIEAARADDRVDADRVAVWVFSGGGPLITSYLLAPPAWLRVLAATYPILDDRPERPLPHGFRPIEALAELAKAIPFVLTRAGLESEEAAAGVSRFIETAADTDLELTVIDQRHGRHGFDTLDHGEESQRAVLDGLAAVLDAVDHVTA